MDVLLVEDDERVQRFVLRGLEVEGYSVTVASDGVDGLNCARSEPYDVMILDVMLPGLDGRTICRQLRESKVRTPILMLTALDQTDEKVGALRGGADDYLTKPFDFDELLARIEALARRGRGYPMESSAELRMDKLVLDRDSMRVFWGDEQLELTAKEYKMLELFVSSPNKVLSRTRILNKVWGYDSDPLTNVVDVYVRRLRSKLGWDSETGWIRTVRNYGYRFDPPIQN